MNLSPICGPMALGLILPVFVAICGPARAVVIYDEASMGDLIDDNVVEDEMGNVIGYAGLPLGPLAAGTPGMPAISSVIGETDGTAADLFSFQIAPGTELVSLKLSRYTSTDPTDNNLFFAIQDDSIFPENFFIDQQAFENNSGSFFGGAIAGRTDVENDVEILPRAGRFVGRGFDGPIGEGDYTFYIQQTNGISEYQFDFGVVSVAAVPEPAFGGLAALIGLAAVRKRRRSRVVSTRPTGS